MASIPKAVKTEIDILDRLLGMNGRGFSIPAARGILKIAFPQEDIDRMHELALKAEDGTLSPDDRAEVDSYQRWGTLIDILHSKARLTLKKRGLSAPVPPRPVPTEYKLPRREKRRTGT